MLAYANCRVLTNVLWKPSFKLEMFVSSFHQFCLLVISWICLTSGRSWVVAMTHTPFLEQWGLSQQFGEKLFAAMLGKKLSLVILSSIPRQLENSSYRGLWSSAHGVEVQFAWNPTALSGGIQSARKKTFHSSSCFPTCTSL